MKIYRSIHAHFLRLCTLLGFIFCFVVHSANAAIAISVPAYDEDGDYTISWTGMGKYFRLFLSTNGAEAVKVGEGRVTSVNVTSKPNGTYTYIIHNYCETSPDVIALCDTSQGTIVVNTPPPVISSIANITINEDAKYSSTMISVTGTGSLPLTFKATSSNTTLITDASLTFSGYSSSRTLKLTPVANANGTSTITVTVTAGGKSTTSQFLVTVVAVDDAPVISVIEDQTLNETERRVIPITITDVDSEISGITLSVDEDIALASIDSSSNLILVAKRLTTKAAVESTRVSIRTTDSSVIRSFNIFVNNLPPELKLEPTSATGVYDLRWNYGIRGVRILENGIDVTKALTGSVNAAPAGSVRVTKTSNGNFSYTLQDCEDSSSTSCSGSYSEKNIAVSFPLPTINASVSAATINEGGNTTLTWSSTNANSCSATNIGNVSSVSGSAIFYAPTVMASNQTTNIVITCVGPGGTTSKTVSITINNVNDKPALSIASNASTTENASFTIPFNISDEETNNAGLSVTAVSSDTSKISNNNITIDRANNRLNVTPVTNATGNVAIKFRVTDAQGLFEEKVVNIAIASITPTVTASISSTIINEGGTATLTWSSTNASACSATNVIGVSGVSGTATYNAPTRVIANQVAEIVVTCTGNGRSTSKSLPITINAVNDKPTLSLVTSVATTEDTVFTIPFAMSDEETENAGLSVTAVSSDTTKIANNKIVIDRIAYRLNITPVANAYGSVFIKVRVTDAAGLYEEKEVRVDIADVPSPSINLLSANSSFIQTLGQTAPQDPATDTMSEPTYKGALTGNQNVAADGSFNYSIPLAIPVGINGIQPKLQLNYNSNAKNGLLGWGWTLAGLSVISRCNANMIRDGYTSGIQSTDAYKYCLDGQRLVEVSANEYRTENESFLRIKKMADYWEVTSNTGTQSRYGFNIDSKLEDDQSHTYAWYLDLQEDIASNSWSVTYNKSSSGSIQSHYPDSIAYTSNPLLSALHEVKFHYENRDDISVKYIAGVRVKNDKRLSRIELKSSAATVHSYILTYQQAGQVYHGKAYSDPAKTSRLASVRQCIGSSLTDCAAPVGFDWSIQHDSNYMFTKVPYVKPDPAAVKWTGGLGAEWSWAQWGVTDKEYVTITHKYANLNGTVSLVDEKIYPTYRGVDINNDGYSDRITSFPTVRGIEFFLGSETGISSTASSTYSIPVSNTFFMAYLVHGLEIGSGTIQNDLNPQKTAYKFDYVDMNADGLLDLVRFPSANCFGSNLWCRYDNVAGEATVPQDISVAFNNGSGFASFAIWHDQWGCVNARRGCPLFSRRVAFTDLNGDGLRDLFAFSAYPFVSALRNHTIGYNNGKGVSGGAFTSVQDPGSSWSNSALTGDFNGDGLMDIANMEIRDDKITVQMGEGKIRSSNGDIKSFLPRTDALAGNYFLSDCNKTAAQTAKCSRAVKDFNNDGLDDIVEWSGSGDGQVYISLGGSAQGNIQFAVPILFYNLDLLKSIANDNQPGVFVHPTIITDWTRDGFYEFSHGYAFDKHFSDAKNNLVANRIEVVVEESRRVKVIYEPLSSDLVYEYLPAKPAGSESNQLVFAEEMKGRRFGVASLEVANGIGSTNKTEYKYKDARTHAAGYGDLGFAEIEKLETIAGQTPLKTITRFYQTAHAQYKLSGRIKQQLVYTSNASGDSLQKLSDIRNQWKVRTYSDDVDANFKSPHYFSYLYQSSNQQWDLDGTKIADSQTQNYPDATASCSELTESPEIVVTNAGSAADIDYSTDGVLIFNQIATCDQSGSTASVQINAVENLDITTKGEARALVQKRNAYAWIGSDVSSATKSAYDMRAQSFAYNAIGQLDTRTIEPDSASANNFKIISSYLYNGFGSVRKITETWDDVANDGLDITTRETNIVETFDTSGVRQVEITKPLSLKETTKFHPVWGLPTNEIDVNGLETTRVYDNQGRPSSITYADGTSTQIDYRQCSGCFTYHNSAVWYKQVKTTGSASIRTYYDGFNREVGNRTKGLGGQDVFTLQTYNSRGDVHQSTAPFFYGSTQQTLAYNYDALGRVTTVSYPDSSSETYTYSGLHHTTTNRLGQTQDRYLNAAGWVMRSMDNVDTPVDFTYWPWGDLKTSQVNDDAKTLVNVAYDKLGRKTELTDPNTGKTTYTYNALGLVATQSDAKSQRTCFGYDALGRQTKRIDNANSNCVGRSQSWSYDTKTNGKGQLASVTGINTDGSNYSEQYSYTSMGLPQSTTYSYGGSSYAIEHHYDSYSRPLAITYPTGYMVANRYNTYGHLSEIIDSADTRVWKANDADAQGNLKQFTLGNNVVTNQTFDSFNNRIETIRAVKGDLVIQDQRYQFDAIGNLSSREDRKNSVTQNFCYDGLNRLKAARFNGCSSAANDYTYDALGNLTAKDGIAGTLGYGTSGSNVAGPHAITSANGWSYKYDAIGNLESATKAGQQTRTVQYSPFNTPTSITQGSNFSTIVYGPNQDRIKHSDSNGRMTLYIGGIYEEVTRNGITQKIHYVGDTALFITKGSSTNATYDYEYQHRDHIGSIVALSEGAINSPLDVQWQANGAWGERRYQQWNGPLDNLVIPTSTARSFTDHEHLDSVGLIHMNGRVYDPELGRFMSADPFVQAPYNSQSYNRYSYVFNNPLSFTDPSGFTCESGSSVKLYDAAGNEIKSHSGSDVTTLCGQDAYDYGRYWQEFTNSFSSFMATPDYSGNSFQENISLCQGGFLGACGIALDQGRISNPDSPYADVPDLDTVLKDFASKVSEIVLARGINNNAIAIKMAKDVEAALQTKKTDPRNGHLAGGTHPKTGVPFDKDGYPDFSAYKINEVKITQTGNRAGDDRAANKAAGLDETPKGYTWHHHQDGKTMQLVPREIHSQTGHTGGYSGK